MVRIRPGEPFFLIVVQMGERRHLLEEEAGKHRSPLTDTRSRDLAVRIDDAIQDPVELHEAVGECWRTSEEDAERTLLMVAALKG